MLITGGTTRVFLAAGVTDMRKSFDTLATLVAHDLGDDPTSGNVYVFCNRRRDRIKCLHFDGSGFWVSAKRLEQGTFKWPTTTSGRISISHEELVLLLSGLDLGRTRRRRWYARKTSTPMHESVDDRS